jgi:glycosyltransferase involved in cell wall biosynthesis
MYMKNNTATNYRIAFYCSSIAWGGLEMNTVRYALWMKEVGHDVQMYCVEQSPIHRQAMNDELPCKLIRRNAKYFDWINSWRISRLLRNDHRQLVWFRDTRDMDVLHWAKSSFGLKIPYLYQQAMQFGVSKKDPLHTMRYSSITAWVSTLPFLAEQVRNMTNFDPSRIHIVPLGVPTPSQTNKDINHRLKFGLPMDGFVLGLIGRIDPLKGQHEAIEALHLLHKKGHLFHLLLVGDNTLHEGNSYREQLVDTISRYHLQSYVHIHGHLKEIEQFHSAIDCFLMCSKGETFGTVTIEAMAYKTPIIATDSSGSPEILNHGTCGMLYPPGDVEALAQCIEHVHNDQAKAQNMAERAAQRFSEEFAKTISVERMQAIIQRLMQE